jgi:hypothetical protein
VGLSSSIDRTVDIMSESSDDLSLLLDGVGSSPIIVKLELDVVHMNGTALVESLFHSSFILLLLASTTSSKLPR